MAEKPTNNVQIYTRAIRIANENNQTVGKSRDLFVTIDQLHSILFELRDDAREEQS